MAWGWIAASAGANLVSGWMGYQSSQDAYKQQQRYMNQQMQFAREQMANEQMWNNRYWGMAQDQMQRQDWLDQQTQSRNMMLDQRYNDQWDYYQQQQALAQQNAERDYQDRVMRQMALDAERQGDRMFQQQEYARMQGLADEDRQRSLADYQERKALSYQRMREQEQMLREAKQQQMAERQWQLNRIAEMDAKAEGHRLDQLDQRNNYLAELHSAQSDYDNLMSDLGMIASPEYLGEDFIEGEFQRLSDSYTDSVDRAVDRIGSQSEADLIRRGMDSSTTGIDSRAQLAERVAPMYQDAQNRAMQDALANTNARNAQIGQQFQGDLTARNQNIQELNQRFNQLGFMRNAPQVGAGLETMGLNPNSAVFTGMPDYQLDIGQVSSGFTPMNMPQSGYAQYGVGSRFQPQNYGAPAGSQYQQFAGANPQGYLGMMGQNQANNYGNMLGNFSNMYGNWAQMGANAFGQSLNNMGNMFGDIYGYHMKYGNAGDTP